MKKRTVTKRRCFCAAKSGRLTLCLLLLAVLLLSLRFGSAAMDWTSFWGGLLRREGFETQALILYSLRLPRLLQGVLAGVWSLGLGRAAAKRNRQRSRQPEHHRRQRRRGVCGDIAAELFPGAAALLPPAAFLGAFLTTLLIMAIAGRADASKATVILAGIAVQALLNAGISCPCWTPTCWSRTATFPQAGCPTPTSACCGCRRDHPAGVFRFAGLLRQNPASVPWRRFGAFAGRAGRTGADAVFDLRQRLGGGRGQLRRPAGLRGPDRAAPRPQADGEPHGAAALGLRADGQHSGADGGPAGPGAFRPVGGAGGHRDGLHRRAVFLLSAASEEVRAHMLSFRRVCAAYGKKQVLDQIDFELPPHTLTAVVGKNGSGKIHPVRLRRPENPLHRGNHALRPRVGGDDAARAGAADGHSAPDAPRARGIGRGAGGVRAEPRSGFRQADDPDGPAARRRGARTGRRSPRCGTSCSPSFRAASGRRLIWR